MAHSLTALHQQAVAALHAELDRRERERARLSLIRFGHAGASIPGTWMPVPERYEFLLRTYDQLLARAFSEPADADTRSAAA